MPHEEITQIEFAVIAVGKGVQVVLTLPSLPRKKFLGHMLMNAFNLLAGGLFWDTVMIGRLNHTVQYYFSPQ
jgi:hypothetical protein